MSKISFRYEVFTIPFDDSFIFYIPQKGLIFIIDEKRRNEADKIKSGQISSDDIIYSPFLSLLKKLNLFGQFEPFSSNLNEYDFSPTSVTLSLTTRCSLSCVYCYARAGEKQLDMPIEIAKAAINYIIENAQKKQESEITIRFHGQGEPTASWTLLTNIINYAKKVAIENNLKINFSMMTNCVLNDMQREFIVRNFGYVCASFDGLPSIQNQQRCLKDKGESFDSVYRTLKYFDRNNMSYGIRATVLPDSVFSMSDSTKFIAKNFNVNQIHFEPVVEGGRMDSISLKDQFYYKFTEEYIKAEKIAEKHKINLMYSGCRTNELSNHFCRAVGPLLNFIVTTQGLVTSCNEIFDKLQSKAKYFIYGSFDEKNHNFVFDMEKLKYLQEISVDSFIYCNSCFLRFICAGDCPAHLDYDLKDVLKKEGIVADSPKCSANKKIAIYKLVKEAIYQTSKFYTKQRNQ
ncbi:MAG: hypothetical protein O8C61_02425 [Candidatus Methanoperedens sp.]|nr:hypothetical protein [Candidatus Methanoperedens sp.]